MSDWQPFADPWDAPGLGWLLIFILLSVAVNIVRDYLRDE